MLLQCRGYYDNEGAWRAVSCSYSFCSWLVMVVGGPRETPVCQCYILVIALVCNTFLSNCFTYIV